MGTPTNVASSESSTSAEQPKIARMGDRIVATILDLVLLFPVLAVAIFFVARVNHIPPTEEGIELHGGPALASMFLWFVSWLLYLWALEASLSKTVGKEMMAIKVTDERGRECGVLEATVRNLLRPVDAIGFYFLGFLVALSSDRNQRIGDRVAGTIVIENSQARRGRAALLWLTVIIVLTGAAILFVHLIK